MSSVGVCVSVTRGASTILRERLLRIPDTCSLKEAKERWAWPRHSDRPAVERDSGDTGNKAFLLVGLMGGAKMGGAKWVKSAKVVLTVSDPVPDYEA